MYVDFVGGTVRVVVLPLIVGIEFVVHVGCDEKEPAIPPCRECVQGYDINLSWDLVQRLEAWIDTTLA